MATRLKFENKISIKNGKISKNASFEKHKLVDSLKPIMNNWILGRVGDFTDGEIVIRTICTEGIKSFDFAFKITSVIDAT